MLTANIGLQDLQSHQRNTLFLSSDGFQIQKLITLTDSQTYYLALSPAAMVGGSKRLGMLPISLQSTAGLCYAYTYGSALTSTGSEITPIYINQTSTIAPLCKFYSGSTPAITSPTNPREYAIGSKSTNQSSGGGAIAVDIEKQFPLNVSVILKLVNQETSTNVISVGVCWFEF